MTSTRLRLGVLLMLAVPIGLVAQSAQELYQRGLVQEHANGDLQRAIALYVQAAQTAGRDRALAAKALMRMAGSQEKLGRGAEAASAYAELVRAYPEQRAEAAIAQERLTALRRATRARPAPGRATSDVSALARPVLARYCATCHNVGNRAGGLALDSLSGMRVSENPALWEKITRRLRARRDPPIGAPRPDDPTYRSVVSELEQTLDAGYRANRPLLPAERASDRELAGRLATFLWDRAPDAPLLEAAERGDLRDTASLTRHVLRMLGDPKSLSLVDSFFAPWLSLDRLKTVPRDPSRYPQFDTELLQAMNTETRLFLHSQLREDRDAVELWTADYSYVNERLGRHYGLTGISGQQFRRVTWPSANRAGLLGQAGPLTAFSGGGRTSPSVRGIFVLTRFLGMDAPPPPANVPPLAEPPANRSGTIRERLMSHKTNPSCASCHSMFDPLGLALENFDATGGWRTTDGGLPIDASGTFIDGSRFDGPAELRAGLLKYRDAYYTAVTQQLLAYALDRRGKAGRVYDYEMPAVRKIVRDASASGYRWSSILAGIAASTPFQMKDVVP
jgi:mono/diheme cytochrome c family protein